MNASRNLPNKNDAGTKSSLKESPMALSEDLNRAKQKKRMPPIHPGEFLREDFLIPLRMTAQMLAKEIKIPERRVIAIVKERRGLDADLCFRLSRFLGMSPEFWMNAEKAFELEAARADWPRICKEIGRHPRDRRTGELKPRRLARKSV
jgi:antitoxin HigA-1